MSRDPIPEPLPYSELHCITNFTFLRGASHPQELVEQAGTLGYTALAITDECSVAGVVRAHMAAKGKPLKLIIGAENLSEATREATDGRGADVVFDLVGGVMFRNAIECLALGGRLIEIASTGQRDVSFDLPDFYHNESRLFGVDTLKRDLEASAKVLTALIPGFVAGDYRAAPISRTYGLADVQTAYRSVAAGAAGRIVLRPQE